MKNLKTVFLFELKSLLRKKGLRVATIIMVLIIILVTSAPSLINLISGGDPGEGEGPLLEGNYGLYLNTNEITQADLSSYLTGQNVTWFEDMASLKSAVSANEIETGFRITSPTSYELVVQDRAMGSFSGYWMDEILTAHRQTEILNREGLNGKNLQIELAEISIESESLVLGKDSQESFASVYILVILIFMLIMFYGNNVATFVAREKSDRTMELLITSSNTTSLMVGKVLASGLVGILQALILVGAIFGGFMLNKSNYPEEFLEFFNLNLPLDNLLVFLVFSLTGYFLFLFIFAAVGSLMTKVEDVPAATTLVTMLVMVSYFISLFTLSVPEGILMKVASILPLTSFMVMFVRYSLSSVSIFEVILSYALLLGTTILMAMISIKIYRFGTMNYGNTNNVFKLIKKALKSNA